MECYVKLECKVRIKNPLGIHARPATQIVRLLQCSRSTVAFTYRKETINPRSIMSILMLAAKKNTQMKIVVDGEDAHDTMEKLIAIMENRYKD